MLRNEILNMKSCKRNIIKLHLLIKDGFTLLVRVNLKTQSYLLFCFINTKLCDAFWALRMDMCSFVCVNCINYFCYYNVGIYYRMSKRFSIVIFCIVI